MFITSILPPEELALLFVKFEELILADEFSYTFILPPYGAQLLLKFESLMLSCEFLLIKATPP